MQTLHIISFDNPYPPNYGGVIDVFYRIRSLSELGCKIHLHCYVDNNVAPPPELQKLVETVTFYRRDKSIFSLLSFTPFAIRSRMSRELIEKIKQTPGPVLFEGLQTTGILEVEGFKDRRKYLRLHNLEHRYFAGQARSEKNLVKKVAYLSEHVKYRWHQNIISKFDKVFTLSVAETDYVQEHFKNAVYIPVFHGNSIINELSPRGKYALYHGDLRLPDNIRAAQFLISVFGKLPKIPLVIASGADAAQIQRAIEPFPNIEYRKFSTNEQLAVLLRGAHVNVMMSFQESGTKLKLVNSLFNSRFCVINANMADDPAITSCCEMAETSSEFEAAVCNVFEQDYVLQEQRIRVGELLSDMENAGKMIKNLKI